jgi:hypothetical protein
MLRSPYCRRFARAYCALAMQVRLALYMYSWLRSKPSEVISTMPKHTSGSLSHCSVCSQTVGSTV